MFRDVTMDDPEERPRGEGAGMLALWAAYAATALAATLIFPLLFLLFLAPVVIVVATHARKSRPFPLPAARMLIFGGVLLLTVWPVFLHVKLGPLPILTPPRLLLYAATAMWGYDMLVSPVRRARFLLAVRRNLLIVAPLAALFALGALSVPFAQGKAIAAGEFVRQTIIWAAPFCAALTYIRREKDLILILKLIAVGGAISGAVALAESVSGVLVAGLLSPFIADAQWLQLAQDQKIRDGIFRAQAGHTHPLSLGELMAFAAPLALAFFFMARKVAHRAGWAVAAILIAGGALATSSRAALLCILIGMAISAAWIVARALRRASLGRLRPLAGLAVLGMIAASPVLATAGYKLLVGAGGEQAARSSQGRADQIEQALPKILARPVTGYGSGRAAIALGFWGRTLTIDNYYLTLALDLGVGGPLAFLAVLIGSGVTAARTAARSAARTAPVYIGLAVAVLCFAMTRSILSMTGNLGIFYLAVAALAGAAAYARRPGVKQP